MKRIIIKVSGLLLFLMINMTMFGKVITDDSGKTIDITKPYKRIISLYGAHTEVLVAIGAKENLIGVEKNSQVKTLPQYSYRDSIERFLKANPDLVLIRPMIRSRYRRLIKGLEDAGITVLTIKPTKFEDLENYWNLLGLISGHQKESSQYVENFRKEVDKLEKISKNTPLSEVKTVFFEARHKGLKTASNKSIPAFIFHILNIDSLASDIEANKRKSTVVSYPRELLISKGETIDIYITQRGAMNKVTKEEIEKTSGFESIRAVREGNILIVDEKEISRPTMKLIDGAKKLGKMVYPKYFKK